MSIDLVPLLVNAWLLTLTFSSALTDARSGLIPNRLTLPTLALAPVLHALSAGPGGALHALGGVLLCGLLPLMMFWLRALGGGDVKLFAALGALCGSSRGLELQLTSYVVAALLALLGAARGARAREVRLGPSIFAAAALLTARSVLGAS